MRKFIHYSCKTERFKTQVISKESKMIVYYIRCFSVYSIKYVKIEQDIVHALLYDLCNLTFGYVTKSFNFLIITDK